MTLEQKIPRAKSSECIVLHVEDSEADAFLTRRTLRSISSSVTYVNAQDAEEALELLGDMINGGESRVPNLILLDINLPKMNGYEFVAALKRDARLRSIPVLFFSGSTSDDDVNMSYASQGACYVSKPMDVVEYKAAIEGICDFWLKIARLPTVH